MIKRQAKYWTVQLTNFRSFYLGKKIAYIYRGQKEIRGTKIRVIWGKVTRPHGTTDTCHKKPTVFQNANE